MRNWDKPERPPIGDTIRKIEDSYTPFADPDDIEELEDWSTMLEEVTPEQHEAPEVIRGAYRRFF